MKIFYIISSYVIIYFIYIRYNDTYDNINDNFRLEILIIPIGVLALSFNHEFEFMEVNLKI